MNKRIFFTILFLGVLNIVQAQNYNTINKEVKKQQKHFMVMHYPNSEEGSQNTFEKEDFKSAYYIYRKRLDIFQRLYVNMMNDTVYILEREGNLLSHDKESTIFTRNNILSYYHYSEKGGNYRKDSLTIIQKPLFPIYMLKLVIKWNLRSLKQEGKENGMIPQDHIWLTRIIFKDRKHQIDCYRFGDFLEYERDFYDASYYEVNDMKTILKKLFE